MMAVRDWINDYLDRHRALCSPHDWPDAGSDECGDYVRGWAVAFISRSVLPEEADAASVQLAANPPRFRKDHLPAVLAVIDGARAANHGAPGSDRETALQQSRNCHRCSGSGLMVVYHPDPMGIPQSCAAHCTCPYGRWMRSKTAPADLRRIPDAVDLRGWLAEPPDMDEWDERVSPHFTVAELIRDWTSRAREQGKRRPARPTTLTPPTPIEPTADQLAEASRRKAELNAQFRRGPEAAA